MRENAVGEGAIKSIARRRVRANGMLLLTKRSLIGTAGSYKIPFSQRARPYFVLVLWTPSILDCVVIYGIMKVASMAIEGFQQLHLA
jgi:hypothetical protein